MYWKASRHEDVLAWEQQADIGHLSPVLALAPNNPTLPGQIRGGIERMEKFKMPRLDIKHVDSSLRGMVQNNDYEHAYTLALAMLRCFTTPGCFPSSSCQTGKPSKIQRDSKTWEEQAFCLEDLKARREGCLVYSFGIDSSPEWEEKVARMFQCEVHAFDPTRDYDAELAPGVTFHKIGLQGVGSDISKTHAAEYDAIDPDLLMTLPEIMDRLNHTGREIDVLMMDCEGCEWGVLKQMACSGESSMVKQIVTEFHFQKVLGLETESDVLNAADGIKCLWQHRWNIVSIERAVAGLDNWAYTRGVSKVIHGNEMLMYVALQQTPENELQASEAMEAELVAIKKKHAVQDMYTKKYESENRSTWPLEARTEVEKLDQIQSDATNTMNRIARDGLNFDAWPRYVED